MCNNHSPPLYWNIRPLPVMNDVDVRPSQREQPVCRILFLWLYSNHVIQCPGNYYPNLCYLHEICRMLFLESSGGKSRPDRFLSWLFNLLLRHNHRLICPKHYYYYWVVDLYHCPVTRSVVTP